MPFRVWAAAPLRTLLAENRHGHDRFPSPAHLASWASCVLATTRVLTSASQATRQRQPLVAGHSGRRSPTQLLEPATATVLPCTNGCPSGSARSAPPSPRCTHPHGHLLPALGRTAIRLTSAEPTSTNVHTKSTTRRAVERLGRLRYKVTLEAT